MSGDDEAEDIVLRRHIGAERQWTPTERGRRGCMVMLVCALVLVLVLLVVGLILAR